VHTFAALEEIVVRSTDERPLPVQVDGDHIGEVTEATSGLAPGALRLVA